MREPEPPPGRPKAASTLPEGSDPRSGGAWELTFRPPGRPKAASALSEGSDPQSGGAWELTS